MPPVRDGFGEVVRDDVQERPESQLEDFVVRVAVGQPAIDVEPQGRDAENAAFANEHLFRPLVRPDHLSPRFGALHVLEPKRARRGLGQELQGLRRQDLPPHPLLLDEASPVRPEAAYAFTSELDQSFCRRGAELSGEIGRRQRTPLVETCGRRHRDPAGGRSHGDDRNSRAHAEESIAILTRSQ